MMARLFAFACAVSAAMGCGRIGFEPADGAFDPAADAGGGAGGIPGLVARYAFDGELIADSAGGHDAVCEDGCPVLDQEGRVGMALSMDGGPAHLRVVDDGAFDTPGGFTVAGWVRHRTLPSRTCMFTKPLGGSANSWSLCTEADGRPFLFACDDCDFVSAPDPIGVDVWVHLCGSFDGTTKRLYVNGAEVASADGSVSFNMDALVIGGDVDGGYGFSTDGLIDDLHVYDRALDPSEIALLARE